MSDGYPEAEDTISSVGVCYKCSDKTLEVDVVMRSVIGTKVISIARRRGNLHTTVERVGGGPEEVERLEVGEPSSRRLKSTWKVREEWLLMQTIRWRGGFRSGLTMTWHYHRRCAEFSARSDEI